MGLVGAFIGIAIMLGIGIQILGNAVQECNTLPGYTGNELKNGGTPSTSPAQDANATGWAAQCVSNNTQSQSAYTLLVIILIVVAAVAILSVVKLL